MTYEAIRHVTEALVDLLSETADYPEVPVNPDEIELISPGDINANSTVRIGLYPYQVRKDGSVGSLNKTQIGDATRRDPPVPVTVDYLVTAYPRADEDNVSGTLGQQQALGLVFQTIEDVGVFEPTEIEAIDQDTRIGLSITELPLDQLLSLYARFDATYQPAIRVEASPVLIQSINEAAFTRVTERDVGVEKQPDSE